MQGYSLSGYLNAVIRRTGRTLLVEGTTDQHLLGRMTLERGPNSGQIDTVDMISDPVLSGKGNKCKVQTIRKQTEILPPTIRTPLSEKFGSLVDREWDGLDAEIPPTQPWMPPLQNRPHFVTRGHSLENYFIRAEWVDAYLRMFFSVELPHTFFDLISSRFHQVVALSTAYSLAIRAVDGISKASGAISWRHIIWSSDRYSVNDDLKTILANRGVSFQTDFTFMVNANVDTYLSSYSNPEPGRWICHGHLGHQAIWACIAHLASEFSLDAERLDTIERGARENKFKFSADCLCRGKADDRAPLDEALQWLCSN